MRTSCARLSGTGWITCVHEVVCGRRTRPLCCDLEIGVACAFIVVWNLRFQKKHAASFIRQQGTRAVSRCWGE